MRKSATFSLFSVCLLACLASSHAAVSWHPQHGGPNTSGVSIRDGELSFPGGGDQGRSYLRSAQSDVHRKSFVAEATVTVRGGAGTGIAFFGMGPGDGTGQPYGEPSSGAHLYLRVAPSNFARGQIDVVDNGKTLTVAARGPGDGVHRIRMTWDAERKLARFEVAAQWKGGPFEADHALTVKGGDNGFRDGAVRLFAGGAAGVLFSDITLRDTSDADLADMAPADDFTSDPTAGTWLPPSGTQPFDAPGNLDALLQRVNGRLRPMVCWYRGSSLMASRSFSGRTLRTDGTAWELDVTSEPVSGDQDARDLTLTYRLSKGTADSAGVGLAFDFEDWRTDNYVLIPASVYNGNRCKIVHRGYAKGLDRKYLYQKNLPLMINPTPHLSMDAAVPSRLEVSSCNAATPAICMYNHETGQGFIVLAEQGIPVPNGVIDHGFMIEESLDRSRASFVITAPGVRERKPDFIGFKPSPDRGRAFRAGDTINLRFRVYAFESDGIPGLLEKFMTVRKAVTGPNHPRELIPFSQVITWMTQRIDSRFTGYGKGKFYAPENASWISFGWIGGLMNTFPMLALGDTLHRDRALQTFDFAIPHARGDFGYFYGAQNHDGKPFGRETYDDHPGVVLSRKNGDVLFWMIKQFELLKAQGHANRIKPAWQDGVRRLADAFVGTWNAHGTWGRMVNANDGRVAETSTCGGVMAIGGLALAADYYRNPEYLKVAREAADYYYRRDFVGTGQTTGGVGDTLQNADSESAAAFMAALMALHEVTGDEQWLEKSRNLANLVATWTTSYDYVLPKDTELARLGAKLAGIYWASTQNKHGAPGICTSSGVSLFKIYRATGDRRYGELIRDIVRCHAESIRPGGYTNERLTYCDAHQRGYRGNHVTGWNELNGILMAMELPGIYVRTDGDEFLVYDHVKARILARQGGRVRIEIENPTKFDADVTVLAENAREAARPLGNTSFISWPKYTVKAGETREITVE